MKLYYAPGACSLAAHIVAREAGVPVTLESVNLKTKQYRGGDYTAVNPKGSVPALELDDGQLVTEAAVILQYLADTKPESKLAAKAGSMERVRLNEWLNYVATEMHKGFGPLWNPKMPDEAKALTKDAIGKKLDYLSKRLEGREYLLDQYTVADAYLFTILNWSSMVGVELAKWPTMTKYYDRVKARPGTQAAMKEEGLLK